MTQEEKAKAYDNVREKIAIRFGSNVAKEIFSEYEESEDEKIRKELLEHCKRRAEMYNTLQTAKEYRKVQSWIAWLEKLEIKEHDVCDFCEDRYGCVSPCPMKLIEEQKPAEWSKNEGKQKQDVSIQINPSEYINDMGGNGCYLKNVTQASAWSEEDREYMKSLLDIINGTPSLTPNEVECHKDWLKSIKDRVQLQPKQKWSEKDQKIWKEISDMLWEGYKQSCSKFSWDDIRNWLKPKIEFSKCRVQPQPKQEWSEEDERFLCKCLGALGNPNYCYEDGELECMRNWLKSLKPKSQWKPSEEQIACLHDAVAKYNQEGFSAATLTSLLEQLKKLREE